MGCCNRKKSTKISGKGVVNNSNVNITRPHSFIIQSKFWKFIFFLLIVACTLLQVGTLIIIYIAFNAIFLNKKNEDKNTN